jgi:transposase
MPACVSTVGIPAAKTPTCDRSGRCRIAKAAQKKLKALSRDPDVDLWAEDEVHFQLCGSRCRMWIPPEIKDPIVRHHPTRKSVGYFGAVRLRDGKLICQRETGKFNGETYLDFLKHLKRRACRSGRRVVMIVDNAKYHHARLHKSWRELHAPDFQLYFLPPYSPELNPIERVWKLTRRKCIHNEYFSNLQNLIETVELQFQFWSEPNRTLRRICAIT